MSDPVTPAPLSPPVYLVPVALRNNLVTYLSARPYGEVADGMRELLALETVTLVDPPALVPPSPAD